MGTGSINNSDKEKQPIARLPIQRDPINSSTPQAGPSQNGSEVEVPQPGPLTSDNEEASKDNTYSFGRIVLAWLYTSARLCYTWAFRERFHVREGSTERDQSAFRDIFAYTILLCRPVAWRTYFGRFFDDLGLSRDQLRADAAKAYKRPFDPIENPSYELHFQTPQMAMWKRFVNRLEEHYKLVSAMCTVVVAIMTALLQQQSNKICSDLVWYLIALTLILVGFSLMVSYELFMRFGEVNANPFNIYMWYMLFDVRIVHGVLWNEWNMLSLPSVYLLWAVIIGCIACVEVLKTVAATSPEPTSAAAHISMRLLLAVVLVSGIASWISTSRTMDFYGKKISSKNFATYCISEEMEQDNNKKRKVVDKKT